MVVEVVVVVGIVVCVVIIIIIIIIKYIYYCALATKAIQRHRTRKSFMPKNIRKILQILKNNL